MVYPFGVTIECLCVGFLILVEIENEWTTYFIDLVLKIKNSHFVWTRAIGNLCSMTTTFMVLDLFQVTSLKHLLYNLVWNQKLVWTVEKDSAVQISSFLDEEMR
jgi:hypothetical protein